MNLPTWISRQFDTWTWLLDQKKVKEVLLSAIHEEITVSARLNWLYSFRILMTVRLLTTQQYRIVAYNVASRMDITDLQTQEYTAQILLAVLLLVLFNTLFVELPGSILLGLWRRLGIYKNQAKYKKTKIKK